ncbi:Inner membrane transport protein YdhP [compost metagenome]
MPSLIGLYLLICILLAIFTFTIQSPVAAVITIFLWGAASFGVMPGFQVRIMSLAKSAPALASTSNHSAGNFGNAAGAFIGGVVITHIGLSSLPWVGSIIVAIGLVLLILSYVQERKQA